MASSAPPPAVHPTRVCDDEPVKHAAPTVHWYEKVPGAARHPPDAPGAQVKLPVSCPTASQPVPQASGAAKGRAPTRALSVPTDPPVSFAHTVLSTAA